MTDVSRFPVGFAWGAATSAYQIEGAPHDDGKGESIWDRFAHTPGRIRDGSTGDVACDHYHRWREDVALMASLGLTAYRFSVAWTRVLPDGTGRINEAGLDFYDRLVDGLVEAGIEPWVTLYHWDLPQALEERGGWPLRATATSFASFAEVVSARLGDRVSRWMTVNEPWEIGFLGYGAGIHAPGRRDLGSALAAIHTVLVGHGHAVQAIRANRPRARIGLALDLVACYPASDSTADAEATERMDGHLNRWFLDALLGTGYPADMLAAYGTAGPAVLPHDQTIVATPLDFIGLNYYSSTWVRAGRGSTEVEHLLGVETAPPRGDGLTAMGWAIHPEGLEDSLLRLAAMAPGLEIAVTESGAAFADRVEADGRIDDVERIAYHEAYLEATLRAHRRGVPVIGYFAWSLLDNFEWAEGYVPRFGLCAVDAVSQRRRPKASADWYRDLITSASGGAAR